MKHLPNISDTAHTPSTPSVQTLRGYILQSLSALPNTQLLGLTVLASSPKRTNSLFPHLVSPPKCYEKEYLVVVSSSLPRKTTVKENNGQASGAAPETELTKPSNETATASSSSSSEEPPRTVLVSALHAYLYTIPSTSTSILYISKLDSSGHAPTRLPITRTLITSFINYHLLPHTRPSNIIRIQLFARSQGQYLFPNSAKVANKRVSGGLSLCGWWKSVYEEVARVVHSQIPTPASTTSTTSAPIGEASNTTNISLRYLLPSYSTAEAAGMLGSPRQPLPSSLQWTYAPPFDQPLFAQHHRHNDSSSGSVTAKNGESSNGAEGSSGSSLASLAGMIPSLPDDPKTRFLDELVLDAPVITKSRLPVFDSVDPQSGTSTGTAGENGHSHSGNSILSPKRRKTEKERAKERDEEDRRVAQTALSRVTPDEFWERMGFRQECISGDVTGFFTLISEAPSTPATPSTSTTPTASNTSADANAPAPPREQRESPNTQSTDLSLAIVDRLHKALLNCDFGTEDLAVEGTAIWQRSVEGIVKDEIGQEGWLRCTGSVKAKELSEQIIQEGTKRKEEVVTMLQPRKKKRAA